MKNSSIFWFVNCKFSGQQLGHLAGVRLPWTFSLGQCTNSFTEQARFSAPAEISKGSISTSSNSLHAISHKGNVHMCLDWLPVRLVICTGDQHSSFTQSRQGKTSMKSFQFKICQISEGVLHQMSFWGADFKLSSLKRFRTCGLDECSSFFPVKLKAFHLNQDL